MKQSWKGKVSEENQVSNAEEEGEPKEPEKKEEVNVPAIFVPSSAFTKCAAILQLFPARAEKVSYFLYYPHRIDLTHNFPRCLTQS